MTKVTPEVLASLQLNDYLYDPVTRKVYLVEKLEPETLWLQNRPPVPLGTLPHPQLFRLSDDESLMFFEAKEGFAGEGFTDSTALDDLLLVEAALREVIHEKRCHTSLSVTPEPPTP